MADGTHNKWELIFRSPKLARKRKRDWPQLVYKYHAVPIDPNQTEGRYGAAVSPPQAMWDQCRKMTDLWNKLCEGHKAIREQIQFAEPKFTEYERKALWTVWKNETVPTLLKAADLNWICGPDVVDRFEKACTAAHSRANGKGKGWPRPRGMTVSLLQRFTAGGKEVHRLCGNARSFRFEQLPTSEGRKTIYGHFGLDGDELIHFRATVHRPLPADAIVKSVRWCGQRSVAFGWEWSIAIQIEIPALPHHEPTGMTAAVDVGWRNMGSGIRVAYLVDDRGHEEDYRLPFDRSTYDTRRTREKYADRPNFFPPPQSHEDLRRLTTERDLALEACKQRLRELLSPLPAGFEKMRSRGLVKLLMELREIDTPPHNPARLEGWEAREPTENEIAARQVLETWIAWDRPRFRVQTRTEQRFAANRETRYRNWAKQVAMRYDAAHVEALQIKRMIEAEKKEAALHGADRNHQIVATSRLLLLLQQACRKYGCKYVVKEAPGTTITCHECGGEIKPGAALELRCENGHREDQDRNAALNLLKSDWPIYVPKRGKQKAAETEEDVA